MKTARGSPTYIDGDDNSQFAGGWDFEIFSLEAWTKKAFKTNTPIPIAAADRR